MKILKLNIILIYTLVCFGGLILSEEAPAQVVRTGYTTIVAGSSGMCLDVTGAFAAANTPLIQWTCHGGANQQWTVVSAGQGTSGFHVIEQQTGQCMDVYLGSVNSDAFIVKNICGTATDELWSIVPRGSAYTLVNQKSGMCAAVQNAGTGGGTQLVQAPCSTASNYLWTFSTGMLTNTTTTVLQAAHSGQCLVVSGGSTASGAAIIQNPCSGIPSEQWILFPYNGQYAVQSKASSLCLTSSGNGIGATLVQATCSGAAGAMWNLVPSGGSYQLTSAGYCLAVNGASQSPATPIGLAACAIAASAPLAQRWSLSAATLPSAWSPVIILPVDPVAVANLANGQLVTWSASTPYWYDGDQEFFTSQTYTSIFDPISTNSTETLVTSTGDDMFCPGTANLTDGRLLVNGGASSPETSIFDPSTGLWTRDASMNVWRGYQGDTVLPNGSVFTLGGSYSGNLFGQGNKTGEIWTKGVGWTILTGVPETNVVGPDPNGIYRGDNHLWLFAAPNGNVFHAGPSSQMNWITTSGVGSITSAGNRGDDPFSINGTTVLYDVGMLMKAGGAQAYDSGNAETAAYTININTNTAVVNKVAPMAYARAFSNGVVLPNGQVVVIGGQTTPTPFTDTNAILIPEIWDPITQVFRQLNPMQTSRTYHSTGILLQDGRVFEGGGGLCGPGCAQNHFNAEILTPPYLLNADGSAATRPTVSSAPKTAALGGTISITTGSPVVSFVLIRLSSVTHTINNDQRRIPLQIISNSGNTYSVPIPSNPGIVLPGNYWIFALNTQGVPSVGATVLIN